MNRIEFFNSIAGIQYPLMLVDFFDHFLALKEIIQNYGSVSVTELSPDNHIVFDIEFKNSNAKETIINMITNNRYIIIYNRQININIIGFPVDNKIKLELY